MATYHCPRFSYITICPFITHPDSGGALPRDIPPDGRHLMIYAHCNGNDPGTGIPLPPRITYVLGVPMKSHDTSTLPVCPCKSLCLRRGTSSFTDSIYDVSLSGKITLSVHIAHRSDKSKMRHTTIKLHQHPCTVHGCRSPSAGCGSSARSLS